MSLKISPETFKKLPFNLDDYDYVVVGDGSGSTIETSATFGCFCLDVARESIIEIEGYVSKGTVNQSEIAPILSLLNYLESSKIAPPLKILVISDSEVTVNCGNKKWQINHNKVLWGCIEYYRLIGFSIDFKWLPRNSNDLMKLADKRSKEIRILNKQKSKNLNKDFLFWRSK